MNRYILIIAAMLTIVASSCKKEPEQKSGLPVVSTNEVTEIGIHSAVCSGIVTDQGDKPINVRGFCWSTSPNPTTSDIFVNTDSYLKADSVPGVGPYKVLMTGLAANTTYYVRAYATNSKGISYGDELSFSTQSYGSSVPEGGVNALFSIDGNGGKVWFSKGNLQHQASTNTWRFSENQWGVCDSIANEHVSSAYAEASTAWIDLFGWGTSGYAHGANCYQPWSTTANPTDYNAYGQNDSNLCDQTGMADWGYNAISNGGNAENLWRTLTKDEWDYLLFGRPNSNNHYGYGQVEGTNGLILLPDIWTLPPRLSFKAGSSQWENHYTAKQWNEMEVAGAVFLPASGMRNGTMLCHNTGSGNYWSSTCLWSGEIGCQYGAFSVYFGYETLASDNRVDRHAGFNVRLVRDFE